MTLLLLTLAWVGVYLYQVADLDTRDPEQSKLFAGATIEYTLLILTILWLA